MSWLLRHNWPWPLLAFLLGAVITWFLLERRKPAEPVEEAVEADQKEEVLVGATAARTTHAEPAPAPVVPAEPTPAVPDEPVVAEDPVADEPVPTSEPMVTAEPEFSRLMASGSTTEPTLFDDDTPEGRFGPGSADAVPHQGPPDGFTIKGNEQSMLFHTPDSPYYGRTKAEVWFRTEADAERAGFTKYVRKPRKSAAPNPQDQ